MIKLSRRDIVIGTAATGIAGLVPASLMAAPGETTVHGLSNFGELKLPPDFKNFGYVNPQAPKGGWLAFQITQTGGNQAFDTFNTLNSFTFKGQGAAGMSMTFDNLMQQSLDEPDTYYGLVAESVRVSADKLTYRFMLRPEARFHDGSKLTAEDVAFSLLTLKDKGHPIFMMSLRDLASVEAEEPYIAKVTFLPSRARDAHLNIVSLPIFSRKYWQDKDFEASTMEAPLGSSAYKVSRFEQGRYIEFERVADYWGKDLPVNIGQNNFDHIRYEYFRDRQVAFEAFKSGILTFHQEFTSRIWATGYDFPAMRDGRVRRESIETETPVSAQGWRFNLRRDKFKDRRIREAIGLAFDFEWTNANIMYSSFKRTTSYFENSDMKAVGVPDPEELSLLEPFRSSLPEQVFGEAFLPPVSDGSGQDRNLLRRANQLLMEAGCKREGAILKLPNGKPFEIDFLDFSSALQPHTEPFQANLRRLGINAQSRIIDAAQYQQRTSNFDFDIVSSSMSGSTTPGDALRLIFGSKAATTPGSLNYGGIANTAADAMIEHVVNATSRAELNVACRALDRILRAEQYWVPMWYQGTSWIAYWDMYHRPETLPRFATGAPWTWWYDPEKARKIGRT